MTKRIVLTSYSKKGRDFLKNLERLKKEMLESMRPTNLAVKAQKPKQ